MIKLFFRAVKRCCKDYPKLLFVKIFL
jgi:hypothetical protein